MYENAEPVLKFTPFYSTLYGEHNGEVKCTYCGQNLWDVYCETWADANYRICSCCGATQEEQ